MSTKSTGLETWPSEIKGDRSDDLSLSLSIGGEPPRHLLSAALDPAVTIVLYILNL